MISIFSAMALSLYSDLKSECLSTKFPPTRRQAKQAPILKIRFFKQSIRFACLRKVASPEAGISIFKFRISTFHYPAPVGKEFLLNIF
jgi:hypothetical protein